MLKYMVDSKCPLLDNKVEWHLEHLITHLQRTNREVLCKVSCSHLESKLA